MAKEIPMLNVAEIENHPLRHTAIFQSFDNLKVGEAFIIRNDHDPLPVYYQLKSMNGPVIKWEYQQKGPQFWDVKVTKTTEDAANEDPLY